MWILTKFVKSHISEQAKSSAKHILSNLYNNIYNAPQPEQPPQSHADKPTIPKKGAFDAYIHDVVFNDIKDEGYEGIKTLLLANDILRKGNKNRPLLKVSVRRYCWVEHVKTGNQNEKKFQARVATIQNV